MSICRFNKNCNWYIFETFEKNKKVFYIYHNKNDAPIICSLNDLKILVDEISQDLDRYNK